MESTHALCGPCEPALIDQAVVVGVELVEEPACPFEHPGVPPGVVLQMLLQVQARERLGEASRSERA
jgi:hypothetical protein